MFEPKSKPILRYVQSRREAESQDSSEGGAVSRGGDDMGAKNKAHGKQTHTFGKGKETAFGGKETAAEEKAEGHSPHKCTACGAECYGHAEEDAPAEEQEMFGGDDQ